MALPNTLGILFAIRISAQPLSNVQKDRAAVHGLERALRTMSEEMAESKGIATVRRRIIGWLDGGEAAPSQMS